jgi:hypothetical protein
MIAAASAFPLLCIAQLAPMFLHYEIALGGTTIFTARAAYVLALGLYIAWLTAVAPINDGISRAMALTVGGGILAVFLPRVASVPVIWLLQLSILVALGVWAHVVRADKWRLGFVSVALGAHAIGALTIYPLCQIVADPAFFGDPRAGYVCNVVLPPIWSGLLPAGLGLVAWAAVLKFAMCKGRA